MNEFEFYFILFYFFGFKVLGLEENGCVKLVILEKKGGYSGK